ncbi:MAG: hypothetical protein IRZ28_09180 [Steroidobacteraceae bacterium]|nr:hypothetical protein [Steroidobacteraceae bacterium]
MARSRQSSSRCQPDVPLTLLCAVGVLCGLTLPGNAAAAAKNDSCKEDVVLRADYFDADIKSDTTLMDNVVITHCDIRVEARRASATGNLDFDDTRLTLDGDVRITMENRGQLLSNQAVVLFRNNQLARATVTGDPAEFEQIREESGMPARGHAGEIVYDVGAGTVRFENDAWFNYGTTEMKGPSLVYNIREEKVQGTRASGERVRITVTPKSTPPKQPANAPPPADPPSGTAPQAPRAP